MTIFPVAAAFFVLRVVRLGSLRLVAYGLCAAAGLLLSMGLARPAARRKGLEPEAAWDAGLFAILGCFVASRLLLVLRDPAAFVRYPLLVLSLPSLTFGGMGVAAVLLFFYLRRKRLPLLSLLDTYAAPAALFAALLELGHALDGSEVGMPSVLPWAVRDPWAPAFRVHPVALYGVLGSLFLAATLWRLLSGRRRPAGRVAGIALAAGGALAYALNLITQPLLIPSGLWLEPGQWLALAAVLAGGLLIVSPLRPLEVPKDGNPASRPRPDTIAPELQKELHECPQRT